MLNKLTWVLVTKEIDEARDRLYNEKIKKVKSCYLFQYQVNLTKANNGSKTRAIWATIIKRKDKM
nr:hypothetical protein [Mycoplasmopsis bovis]